MPEPVIFKKGKETVPYHWAYGEHLSHFFDFTKAEKKIYGSRCPVSKQVIVPPMGFSAIPFVEMEKEWVEVSDHGELMTYTTVFLPFPGQPTEPPYTIGLVRLDGTDSLFLHLISEVEPENLQCGMRVQAVWSEDRKGDMYDIQYFKPEA